jgi:hypothetical protein
VIPADLAFFEYALWTIAGLWSILFVAKATTGPLTWVVRVVGALLIGLSLLRALLEKNAT